MPSGVKPRPLAASVEGSTDDSPVRVREHTRAPDRDERMSSRSLPATGAAAAEDELLAQLGLPASASPEDVDNLHDAVSAYLAAAPSGIRGWAHAQAAALDAAYLHLTDPVGLEGSALKSPTRPPAVVPGGPATPPVRRDSVPAAVPVAAAAVAGDITDDQDDPGAEDADDEDDTDDDELGLEPGAEADAEDLAALYASVTPSAHEDMAPSRTGRPTKKERREARRQVPAAPVAPVAAPKAEANVWKRAFLATLAVIAVVAIALGANAVVNNLGAAGPTASAPAQAQTTAPAVDQAKIAALMQKLADNPNDIDTLQALGDEFYFGQQFDIAATWYDKVLAVDSKNTKALNAKGAIAYNSNDFATAETTWKQVLGIDAKNTEAHFNLGFLYLNQQTPDMASVQREWTTVVALEPTSQFGQVAKAHLDSLAAASMLPAASGAPAASPAAPPTGSAAPSGSSVAASPAANVLQQTAKDLAFGTKELAAPADTQFTIHFDNQDSLPHDIVIKDASGAEVFKGELVTGPQAVDYAVPALKAGAYTFVCSVHPNMTGTLTVGS
jgi:cytochrome c-type biogenesis protein CcmH/NrfG/plastocyanin